MKVIYLILLALTALLAITYFTGPKVPQPVFGGDLPRMPEGRKALDQSVVKRESQQTLREDNHARIRWHNDAGRKTEYSIVYLHGFGGSYRDGYPVNVQIADSLKANSYLGRWGGHGQVPPEVMQGFTAESAWADARHALAVGKAIGDKVIIMSTSTGGTLALKLAAEFPDDVHALINISPNVKDDMPGTWLLNSPWGYEIAQLIGFGDDRREVTHENPAANQYFDTIIPVKALVDLQNLVATTMKEETYRKVHCPVLTLYYYKDAFNEDERVEVDVYPAMHEQLATPDEQKQLTSLPTPGTHFMGCALMSEDTESVKKEVEIFLAGLGDME